MYFWKTAELAKDLASDEVPEPDKFKYLLGGQILYTIFIYVTLIYGAKFNVFLVVEFLAMLSIAIYGTLRVYQNNGGAEGRLILERFGCLAFPLTIKITILMWGIYLFYMFTGSGMYNAIAFRDPMMAHNIFIFILAVGTQYIYFWRMWTHMESVSGISTNK